MSDQIAREPLRFAGVLRFRELLMTRLLGREIFKVGTHTDSSGFTATYTAEDIDRIVERFNAGDPEYVSVKIGHTSNEHNEQFAAELKALAAQLGVPGLGLTGENGGQDGVLSLGRVIGLRRVQDKLVADFDVVPEMASLVERRMLRDVSVEMVGEPGDLKLTGVAWLGAELPAVKDLNGLAAAATLRQRIEGPVLAFKQTAALGRDEGDKPMSWLDTLRSKFSDKSDDEFAELMASKFQEEDDEKDDDDGEFQDGEDEVTVNPIGGEVAAAVRAVAGCDINCSDEELLEALRSLVGLPSAGSPEEMVPVMKARLGQKPVEFKDSPEYRTMSAEIGSLKRDKRLAHYQREVVGLLVQGADEDLAEELVSTEEEAGVGYAEKLLASWKRESDANKQYTKSAGRAPVEDDTEYDFEKRVKERADEKKISFAEAKSELALEDGPAWEAYRSEKQRNLS